MSALARVALERLLQARKLIQTIPLAARTGAPSTDDRDVAATGVAALDARLEGGWPRGQVSEVVGPVSTGTTWIACASLAAATRRGELSALVDPVDTFDPQSAVLAGFDWSHFLWVRGTPPGPLPAPRAGKRARPGDAKTALGQALDRALKALALIAQSDGFGLVVVDLQALPSSLVRQLPFTTWRRIQRMVEGRDRACLVLAREPLARSAGGVSLVLEPSSQGSARWTGLSARRQRLAGLAAQARVRRASWQKTTLEDFAWASGGPGPQS